MLHTIRACFVFNFPTVFQGVFGASWATGGVGGMRQESATGRTYNWVSCLCLIKQSSLMWFTYRASKLDVHCSISKNAQETCSKLQFRCVVFGPVLSLAQLTERPFVHRVVFMQVGPVWSHRAPTSEGPCASLWSPS